MRTIKCVNQSKLLSPAEFAAGIGAVQLQVYRDFFPSWNEWALLEIAGKAGPGEEAIYFSDQISIADALGYHTVAGATTPVGFVDVALTLSIGDNWTATASHEVLEQLYDPLVQGLWYAPFAGGQAALAQEVADPVEAEEYPVNGWPVSDFVLPRWTVPDQLQAGENVDFLGVLKAPLAIAPGGYVAYTSDLQSWNQALGETAAKARRTPHPHSRIARRLRGD